MVLAIRWCVPFESIQAWPGLQRYTKFRRNSGPLFLPGRNENGRQRFVAWEPGTDDNAEAAGEEDEEDEEDEDDEDDEEDEEDEDEAVEHVVKILDASEEKGTTWYNVRYASGRTGFQLKNDLSPELMRLYESKRALGTGAGKKKMMMMTEKRKKKKKKTEDNEASRRKTLLKTHDRRVYPS